MIKKELRGKSYSSKGLEKLFSSNLSAFLLFNQKEEIVLLYNLNPPHSNFLKKLQIGQKVRIATGKTSLKINELIKKVLAPKVLAPKGVAPKGVSSEGILANKKDDSIDESILYLKDLKINDGAVPNQFIEVGMLNELLPVDQASESYYYLIFREVSVSDDTEEAMHVQPNYVLVQQVLDFLDIKNAIGRKEDGNLTFQLSKGFKAHYGNYKDRDFFGYIHAEDQSRIQHLLDQTAEDTNSLIVRLQYSNHSYHYSVVRCLFYFDVVVLLISDIDYKLRKYLKDDHDFFCISDLSQNILAKGERNDPVAINKNSVKDSRGHGKVSGLGLSKNDSELIDASFRECFDQGVASCKVAIKSVDDQAQKKYKLKHYKISDGNAQTLGVMSLFQAVGTNGSVQAEPSDAETSVAETSGAEPSVAESSNMDLSVFENMFDLLTDSIVLAKANGKISYTNKSAKNLLKDIQPKSEEQAFTKIWDLLRLDDLLTAQAEGRFDFKKSEHIIFEKTDNERIALNCESKLLRKNTEQTLLFFVIKNITEGALSETNLQNELKMLQETYQQVLEQNIVQYEQKMQIKEEFEETFFERNILDTFFNSNNTASIILDRHLNVKYFNGKANSLIMLLNGIYLDKKYHISNYHLPCNHGRFEKYAKEALKGNSLKMLSNTSIRNKNKLRTYEIVFIPLSNESDAEPNHLACSFTDVSDLQERQNQLDLFENVVEYANEGIIVTKANPLHDPGPEIIYVNHAMEKLSGYNASELIGENPRILQGQKTDRNALNRIKQALIKGKPIKEELINYTKLGKAYWVELSITPIFDKLGKVSCFVSHQKDITARKDNEIERSTMIKHLLRQNQELDEFAFITSHNLRAPVARLLGLTDLIGYELDENRLPKELFKHVETSANLLDEIIRDLNYILAFKKHIGEKQEVIHFEKKINKIKIVLSKQIEASKAEIICDFKDCPTVYSIDSYVGNIMEHLIHNSIKYARKDVTPRIEVKTMYKDMAPCIQISDNGMGFPSKISDTDFMLYRRFHPEIPGKGLGLFLVKSHVEMLRGSLKLESKENEGSIFTIVFPPESEQPLNAQ